VVLVLVGYKAMELAQVPVLAMQLLQQLELFWS
jgi:hypothetical protein